MKKLEKSDLFLIIFFVIIVIVTIVCFVFRDVGALLDVSN